jgi:ferric-dicitrate binding protein FerR (iron transport regulator)
MNYQNYKTEDFVLNEGFRQWVLQGKNEAVWIRFLEDYPEKKEEIQQARQIVLGVALDVEVLPADEVDHLRQRIFQKIASPEPKTMPAFRFKWYKVAASLTAILLVSLFAWWYSFSQLTTYATGYGEIKKVRLPDGSTAVVNANSQISWKEGTADREVILKGEAYFEIKKKENRQKFIVHTDDIQIEVLGTSFNVKSRRKETQVVLTSGKVALHHISSGEKALMQPGSMVTVSNDSTPFVYQQVNTQLYTSWTDNRVLINNTTLEEIAGIIEDTYGYDVEIVGETLKKRRFTATTSIPLKELDMLLKLIEITFEVDVTRKDNQIIILPRLNKQSLNR